MFRYPGATAPALDRVSFSIPEGSVFGIVGRSGSGKTTVTRLLQALHSDYQGLIKIDGNDLREIDVDHLRSSLGVVLQENFLFRGSIRENDLGRQTRRDVRRCSAGGAARRRRGIHRAPARRAMRRSFRRGRAICRADSASGWRSPAR